VFILNKVKNITKGTRHKIVRIIAPNLYKDYLSLLERNNEIPRPMVVFLKEYFKDKLLVGCEIGVSEGLNSLSILNELNIKELYLVDPYAPYFQEGKCLDYSKAEGIAHKRFKEYKGKVIWVKEYSESAVKNIKSPLDFCYIDGNHQYLNVVDDISNYFPLIKQGGVIGGHDFNGNYLGVCRAVIEFSQKTKLVLQTKKNDWWTIKEEMGK